MRQSLKGLMGLVAVAALATPFSTVYAARVVQGTILDLPSVDPFAGRCVEQRSWSGVDANVLNGNAINTCLTTGTGACSLGLNTTDLICNRLFLANVQATGRPGYSGFADDKSTYNADSDNQPMYILWENITNPTASNYVSYYYAASQIASNNDLGKISDSNCTGTIAVACFMPGTSTRNGGSVINVPGGPLGPQGGLAAIPVPRIGTVVGNTANLSWDPAPIFDNGQGAANVFKFYRIYRWVDGTANGTCGSPLENDPLWLERGTSATEAFSDTTLPTSVDCVRYALKLVYTGPANINSLGNANGELSTKFKGSVSAGISRNPLSSQITNFGATYAGKGTVNVGWTGAVETGLAGYYLGRSINSAGPYHRITDLVPVRGDGSVYAIANKVSRKESTTFWYQLELVKTDGSIVTITPASVTLPTKQGTE